MSMATELIALIKSAQDDIDRQSALLGNYRQQLETLQSRVDEALSGSTRAEEREMRQQLARTLKQVDDTTHQLAQAKAMLGNVLRAI